MESFADWTESVCREHKRGISEYRPIRGKDLNKIVQWEARVPDDKKLKMFQQSQDLLTPEWNFV